MRTLALFSFLLFGGVLTAQIQAPRLSPKAEIKQTIGLTDFTIIYHRPGKRGRVIFGDLLPYGELWRTGANENTTIAFNSSVIIGKDTLKAGKYAIFTRPEKDQWTVYFYAGTDNWGTPENWDESLVKSAQQFKVSKPSQTIETFTISLDNLTTESADLNLTWDDVLLSVPLKLMTGEQMEKNIKTVMAGPGASDYYRAADYYYGEKKELKQALEWITKAIEMSPEPPFWMLRKKSLIQAELGDYKGAIETAKLSLDGAEKASNADYIRMNKASIEEWSKKK